MPDCCSVFTCSNRANREKDKGYYRIPKGILHKGETLKKLTKRRREKWLSNLSLSSKGIESPHARVCGEHFVKGRPSNVYDEHDVDWAPTLKLGHQKLKPIRESAIKRNDRNKKRYLKRRHSEAAVALLDLQKLARLESNVHQEHEHPGENNLYLQQKSNINHAECQTERQVQYVECQTDLTVNYLKSMEEDIKRCNEEICTLKEKALEALISRRSFEKDNDKTKFYTGLPNFLVL
ncbi:uncharacterized protein LOC124440976 isoform X2 [Xenia sp. Carnegie-2017]|uniref:uncharacterized protein LOC124440976 isoform X2 n=1 Tax=Xenia sp. Carnegie-2017 TaxID=2897299 RepID=UPI001F03688D|nr:uncharacterized protein LOC124440976 isoform X2 [Xenia sp. Carnegie-2017]